MKWILIFAIAVMVLLDRFARKVKAFTNMVVDGNAFTDPSLGTFTSASMGPEYEDAGSHQWGSKVVDDIAWIYNNVTSRYWEKFYFFGTWLADAHPSGDDEIYFDTASGRDYNGKRVFFFDAILDHGDNVLLTTSYQALFGDHVVDWEVKALAGGGFQIHNKFGTPRSLDCWCSVCRIIANNS